MKTENSLKFNYAELDKFLDETGLNGFNKDLARGFRDFLCGYSDLVNQVASYNYNEDDKIYVEKGATGMIYQLENLFRILENLKEIPKE